MPRLSTFYGIVICMYVRDHGVAHVHALYGDERAVVDVAAGAFLAATSKPLSSPAHLETDRRAVVRVCGMDSTLLDRMDLERHASGIGDQADVRWVRGDDGMPSADRPLDHGHVDDVVVARTGRQRAGRPGLGFGEILDVAAFQESRQGRLGAASPSLSQHSRRDHRRQSPLERGAVK